MPNCNSRFSLPHTRICAICEEVENPNTNLVCKNEFYLCHTCLSFFKKFMLKKMEEDKGPYVMKVHE